MELSNETSMWRYVDEEVPNQDGDYITALSNQDRIVFEIAPWRNGKYQGCMCMAIYCKLATIICWMPIPPIDLSKIEFDNDNDILI